MARRGENIRKRKDGRWEGRYIQSYDQNGRAKYKSVYAPSYKEVKEKLTLSKTSNCHENQYQNLQQDYTPNASIPDYAGQTIAQTMTIWLESARMNLKYPTYVKYYNLVQHHILPPLGQTRVSDITSASLMQFLNTKLYGSSQDTPSSKKLSTNTVRLLGYILKSALSETAAASEVHTIKIKSATRHDSKEPQVLQPEDFQRLEIWLTGQINARHLGILICMYTGIRLGEICALKWEDIDLKKRTIKIQRTIQRIQNQNQYQSQSQNKEQKHAQTAHQKTFLFIAPPKSPTSVRTIPIPDILYHYMIEYIAQPIAQSPLAVISTDSPHPSSGYILTESQVHPAEPRTCQNQFKRCLSGAGLASYNFHALRHTFATRCIEAGCDAKTLSEILGHANVNITLNRYVHSNMELKRRQLNRLSHMKSNIPQEETPTPKEQH